MCVRAVRTCMLYIVHIQIHAVQCNCALRKNICTHFASINAKLSSTQRMYYLTIIAMVRCDFIGFVERIHRNREKYLCTFVPLLHPNAPFCVQFDSTCLYCLSVCKQKERTATKKLFCCIAWSLFSNVPVVFTRSIASNQRYFSYYSRMLSSLSLLLFLVFDLLYRFYRAQ